MVKSRRIQRVSVIVLVFVLLLQFFQFNDITAEAGDNYAPGDSVFVEIHINGNTDGQIVFMPIIEYDTDVLLFQGPYVQGGMLFDSNSLVLMEWLYFSEYDSIESLSNWGDETLGGGFLGNAAVCENYGMDPIQGDGHLLTLQFVIKANVEDGEYENIIKSVTEDPNSYAWDDHGAFPGTYTWVPSVITVSNSPDSNPETFGVTVATLQNGVVTPSVTSAEADETITLTVTPDQNYALAAGSLKVNGGDVELTPGGENTYTFTMPGTAVTVTAEFIETLPYQITVNPPNIPEGGQIYAVRVNTPVMSGMDTSAKVGDTVYVSINDGGMTGYQRKSVTYQAEGEEPVPLEVWISPGIVRYWIFTMPAKDVTLSVEYEALTYKLTVEDSEFGKIVLDKYEAAYGETVTGTVTPKDDWLVRSVAFSGYVTWSSVIGLLGQRANADLTSGPFSFEYTIRHTSDHVVSARYYKHPDWQGSGTEDDPYLIEDEARLVEVRDRIKADNLTGMATAHFKLTADLDLTKVEENWDGNFSLYALDGDGHTINYNSVHTEVGNTGTALFGGVDTLRNLTVTGRSRAYVNAGGIVMSASNSLIENCVSYVDVSASNGIAGGIAAYMGTGAAGDMPTIRNCVNRGRVSAGKIGAGGIVGEIRGRASIIGCVNYSIVSSDGSTGGISGVREAQNLTITNCRNEGQVNGPIAYGIGNASIITGCYNTGEIVASSSGTAIASGIGHASFAGSSIAITNSYNTGNIVSNGYAGGITNVSNATTTTVENCYNAGQVSGSLGHGGIIDKGSETQSITVTNSHYLDTSVGEGAIAGYGEAVTSAELLRLAETLGDAYTNRMSGYPILNWQESDPGVDLVYTVDGGSITAEISGSDVTKFKNSEGDTAVVFDLTRNGTTQTASITITGETLTALRDSANGTDGSVAATSLAIKTDAGELSFNAAAITEIAAAAGTDAVTLEIKLLESSSNAQAQALITSGAHVYEFTLTADGKPIYTQTSNKGAVSVSLPYTRQGEAGKVLVKVYHIPEIGDKTEEMPDAGYSNGDRRVSFTVNHFSLYAVQEIPREQPGDGGAGGKGGKPDSLDWDGETIDVRWYDPNDADGVYYIYDAADLAGLAAIVNGLYNEEIIYFYGDDSHEKIKANSSVDADPDGPKGNNQSTAQYYYGTDDFADKTVIVMASINMGAGNNYMPVGGQYLMSRNDSSTKISSSFNGTFDGGGNSITIYTDRHCSNGNYGDGSSVGLIGRLGVHDGEDGGPGEPDLRAQTPPAVKNVAVYGSVKGNRSVGGIVGKIGKTNSGGYIENCANFATVVGTDAKGTGGIVGAAWNGGAILNCYNVGSVTGGWPAGGIAGSNEIRIENCYNVGPVSSTNSSSYAQAIGTRNGSWGNEGVVNSYFLDEYKANGGYYKDDKDIDNSGIRVSEHMKTEAFVNELNDTGETTGSFYVMDTQNINKGYPVLAWQGGTAVNPGAVDNTNNNETPAESTTTVDGDAATTIVDAPVALTDDPTLVVINVDTDGAAVSSITAEVTAENVKAIADNGSSIEVRSDLGSVRLPNAAVTDLASKSDEKIDVKLTKDSADTYTLALTADDKAIATVDGGIKLTLPAEHADPGTVAVLVRQDGTEEVIKKSVGKDGTVSVPLDGSATIKIVDNAKAFADVTDSSWYNDAVRFASSHELLTGTGVGRFSPEASMTRGMLVTVLYRLENEPTAAGDLFADVPADAYYADAATWANASNIVNGTGAGKFSPNAPITREQLATMLYRYHQFSILNSQFSIDTSADLSAFPDADDVSDWAEDAMKWAVGIGLIQGRDSGLAPQGTATRAEVATILQRFIEQL